MVAFSHSIGFQASALTFRHTKFKSSPEHIEAMDGVAEFLEKFTFDGGGTCFSYNDRQYFWNETNKVHYETTPIQYLNFYGCKI